MNSEAEFKNFYEAILNSLEVHKVPPLDDNLFQMPNNQSEDSAGIRSYTQIMISSWIEFLNNLFSNSSADSLLSNLNNHLTFIKRLDQKEQRFHLHYFRLICAKLFHYLIQFEVVINTHFEIEDDYKSFELDLALLKNQTNLSDLVLYTLAQDFSEINQITEKHIQEILISLKNRDHVHFNQNLNQLRAIQETILTILQLDRKEQKSLLVRKLQKEFELINRFCFILQKIMENRNYDILSESKLEFRSSYDYPFLDVLKNLGKWYSSGEATYLKNSKEIIGYIRIKKPFRKEDVEFFSRIENLVTVTDDYLYFTQAHTDKFMEPFKEYLSDPAISWILKRAVIDFLVYLGVLRNTFETNLQETLDFFLHFLDDQNITLIYRRQIFVNLALMVQAWIKKGLIESSKAQKVVAEIVRINKNLKKQPLKKMGNFQKISYHLPPELSLSEYEKGLSIHLLYALEDFPDWIEGKRLRQFLVKSALSKNPRYLISENLYKIAAEISEYKKSREEIPRDIETKSALIKGFCKRILDDYFKLLPELFQLIYSSFIIHIIHLASEAETLLPADRDWLLEKFGEMKKNQYKQMDFPLLQYSESKIFSESYEKEFSSIITVFHLYIPIS